MDYIRREIAGKLLQLASQYPVVTITGPRQSGKTTLARRTFPRKGYYNLEDPVTRNLLIEDPRTFFNSINEEGAIIDEIQRVPELTSFIQPIVDDKNSKGQFILTGSHQFEIIERVSQSLSGRTGLLKLLPFSLYELQTVFPVQSASHYLFNGFYPGIYHERLDPVDYYGMYLETYIERDLRSAIAISNLTVFERFLKLLAGRTGNILNLSSLSNDTGASVPTIKQWISVLEASYIVFLLQPFYGNISKRLIKSPKVYFHDVGLAVYLNGIESPSQIESHPLRGALFENCILSEFIKSRYNKGRKPNLYFYRDSAGTKVDVIYQEASAVRACEIKSAQTPHPDFVKGITSFKKAYTGTEVSGLVFYGGNEHLEIKNVTFTPWDKIAETIKKVT